MQCDRILNLPPGPFSRYVIKCENDSADVDCFFVGVCGLQQTCATHSEQHFSHSAEKLTHFHLKKKSSKPQTH